MDELDSRVFNGLKDSIRKVVHGIGEDILAWHEMPIILIDYHDWEVTYFEDEDDAEKHVAERYTTDWDDGPPSGEDDELVVIKYCTQHHKDEWGSLYGEYKLFKVVNGIKIYREKSFVEFEPELIINVCI